MKIDAPRGPALQGVGASTDAAAAKRASGAAAARTDAAKQSGGRREDGSLDGVTVKVSAAAQQRLDGAAAHPRFDAVKVERLRATLEAGDLPVDSERIASRLAPSGEGDPS